MWQYQFYMYVLCTKENQFLRKSPKLSFPSWCKYLDEISATKKKDANVIKTKLVECGPPGITGGTKIVKSAALKRLTATSA